MSRPPDRLKLYEEIESEVKTLNDAHYEEQQELLNRISILEMDVKRLKESLSDAHARLNKRIVMENRHIQVNLDMEEKNFVNEDEIKSYYDNINYFVTGGKARKLEWVTFLITDIINSKLKADYEDFNTGRNFSSLRQFVLQYFLKKFECRGAGLSLLRDFFYTMSQKFQESLRVETFLLLTECNSLRTKLNIDINELLRKNKVGSAH